MDKNILSEPKASNSEPLFLKCWGFNRSGFQLLYSGLHNDLIEAIKESHLQWEQAKNRYTRMHYKVLQNDHCIASGDHENYNHPKNLDL